MLTGGTLDELAARIDARLAQLGPHTGGLRLAPGFAATARATIKRFSAFAKEGLDADFGRGSKPIQLAWQAWQGEPRPGLPNPCLAPFAGRGPYHCIMLVAGALDTKGGPRVNRDAQVLSVRGDPIPGLYGAGNCIASPTGAGYWGGGGTIGPALTFGYIAGTNAAAEPSRLNA